MIFRKTFILFLGLLSILTIFSCKIETEEQSSIAVKEVKILYETKTVEVGKTISLSCKIIPSNATASEVEWESQDTNIAKISKKGVVTGLAAGNAAITATVNNQSDIILIKVVNPVVEQNPDQNENQNNQNQPEQNTPEQNPPAQQPAAPNPPANIPEASPTLTGISISGNTSVNESCQTKLAVIFTPAEAACDVVWQSMNTAIATVSQQGTVTGIAEGKTQIKAFCGNFTSSYEITVVEDIDPETAITKASDIIVDSSINKPFGEVVTSVGDGKFTICFGNPGQNAPDYWDLFLNDTRKVKLYTCGVTTVRVAEPGTYSLKLFAIKDGKGSEPLIASIIIPEWEKTPVNNNNKPASYLANETLVNKKETSTLTMQFKNNTNGHFKDDQIYVTSLALNSNNEWCYLAANGTLIPVTVGEDSSSWSFKLSDVSSTNGLQLKSMSSGRMYFGMGEPVYIKAIGTAAGIGIVQPNLANPSDPNANKLFDWIEFTAGSNGLFVNTTQVDAFTVPIVISAYKDDGMGGYEWFKSVGITETRAQIFAAWETWTNKYTSFKKLNQDGNRIVAPCKGKHGDFDRTYMDKYIRDMWDYYKQGEGFGNHKLTFSHPDAGSFEGYVDSRDVFCFTSTGDRSQKYYILGVPTIEEAFEGSGRLASISNAQISKERTGVEDYVTTNGSIELVVQNMVCSAFTRHVMQNPEWWTNPDKYYLEEPANMYSAFWHKHNIDGYAYGFCYDDNNDQSTTVQLSDVRGLVIGIGW